MIDAKRKALIFLVIAFIFALLTTVLVMSGVREVKKSMGETVSVAVAEEDIPAYTDFSESLLDYVEIPKSEQLSSYIQEGSSIKDSVVVVNVEENSIITENVLRPKRSKLSIEPNHRVVWLNATENVIIDQDVLDGDRVDIIVTVKGENNSFTTSRLLENIKVVRKRDVSEGKDAVMVSLPLNDAERLIHYQNMAHQIRALRVTYIPEDAKKVNTTEEEETK